MHLYMGYNQPLFIQSIMPIKSLFDNNEVKIHIRGLPATGDLARPFKTAAGFMGGGAPETDKAAIKVRLDLALTTEQLAHSSSASTGCRKELWCDGHQERKLSSMF